MSLTKVTEDPRFDEVIMNALPEAIYDVMGDVSPELVGELGCEIMGRIGVINQNGPYAENNIWKTRYEALFRHVKKNYAESYVDGAEYSVGLILIKKSSTRERTDAWIYTPTQIYLECYSS